MEFSKIHHYKLWSFSLPLPLPKASLGTYEPSTFKLDEYHLFLRRVSLLRGGVPLGGNHRQKLYNAKWISHLSPTVYFTVGSIAIVFQHPSRHNLNDLQTTFEISLLLILSLSDIYSNNPGHQMKINKRLSK